MKEQSAKWIDIALGYISDVVLFVHQLIQSALELICPK